MSTKKRKENAGLKIKVAGGTLLAAGASAAAVCAAANHFFQVAVVRDDKKRRKRKRPQTQKNADRVLAAYNDEIQAGMEWLKKQETEMVLLESSDGLMLAADLLEAPEASGTIILSHGYRSTPEYNFACVAQYYHEKGFHLLFVHHRAHGKSEGKYITMGVKESRDLADWAQWTADRFGSRHDIFLNGISMGATAVLLASGFPLPQNVRGIIADCGFTSPYEIFCHILKKDYHLPKFPLLYTTEHMAKKKAGFCFQEADTRRALKGNQIPVLFIHGGMDDFVPVSMSIENYKACNAEKMLFIVEEASHATSYMVDRDGHRRALDEFLKKYRKNEKTAEKQI